MKKEYFPFKILLKNKIKDYYRSNLNFLQRNPELNMTPQKLSYFLSPTTNITISNLILLCRALDLEISIEEKNHLFNQIN